MIIEFTPPPVSKDVFYIQEMSSSPQSAFELTSAYYGTIMTICTFSIQILSENSKTLELRLVATMFILLHTALPLPRFLPLPRMKG